MDKIQDAVAEVQETEAAKEYSRKEERISRIKGIGYGLFTGIVIGLLIGIFLL